jgi:hypothetical protein
VYRVDVIVASVKAKTFTEEDNVLRLNYAKGYAIPALAESIKLAVRDVAAAMPNKTIYTFYIKITK